MMSTTFKWFSENVMCVCVEKEGGKSKYGKILTIGEYR